LELTGLNEAFVINETERKKLIADDPKSAELIKPWLRGRDIKKWKAEWAGLYLITIPSSGNKEWPWSKKKTEAKARQIFAKNYPAIHQHLSGHEDKLKKRDDQGQFWWELRSCAYYEEFNCSKIIIPAITSGVQFAIDKQGFYSNDKTSICVHQDSEYLCALMNSKVMWWFIRQLAATRRGDYYEFKPMYVQQLPIIDAEKQQKDSMAVRAQKILALEQSAARLGNAPCKTPDSPNVCRAQSPIAPQTDVSKLEAEIDQMVYQLYGLTPEEIAIVERK
jgi:adenine-specific DNA-methyltransferase